MFYLFLFHSFTHTLNIPSCPCFSAADRSDMFYCWCVTYTVSPAALGPFQSPTGPLCPSGVSTPSRDSEESFITDPRYTFQFGRDKQLAAITSLNLCAKATLISLIMNNGGGNREACLCKFPHTVISSMLNSQITSSASENNPPPSFSQPFVLLLPSTSSPYSSSALCVVNRPSTSLH